MPRHLVTIAFFLVAAPLAAQDSPRLADQVAPSARLAGAAAVPATARVASPPVAAHSLARRGTNATGGVIGAVLGAAAGAAIGCLANEDDYGVFCAGQNDTIVVVGAALGALAGWLVGSRIGGPHD